MSPRDDRDDDETEPEISSAWFRKRGNLAVPPEHIRQAWEQGRTGLEPDRRTVAQGRVCEAERPAWWATAGRIASAQRVTEAKRAAASHAHASDTAASAHILQSIGPPTWRCLAAFLSDPVAPPFLRLKRRPHVC